MGLQLAVSARNARLAALIADIGASPTLKILVGAPPVDCATADPALVLATVPLPPTWMQTPAGGQVLKTGTWQDPAADADGTAGHFRIFDSGGSVCKLQGTVSATGAGGDMQVLNPAVTTGELIVIVTFTLVDANG
jgi:hypothetical protein